MENFMVFNKLNYMKMMYNVFYSISVISRLFLLGIKCQYLSHVSDLEESKQCCSLVK